MPERAIAEKFAEFLAAQDPVYPQVLRELAAGRKETHWMWFIFPQLAGLGSSVLARMFALDSLAEAKAYGEHPILGFRLRQCTRAILAAPGGSIDSILGYPDNLKFRSCLTLFAAAEPAEPVFRAALQKFFDAEPDPITLRLLAGVSDQPRLE